MLRISIILALVLMLSAGSAYAFGGAGSIVVDIVGSEVDNTKVISSGMEKVELEFVGSKANNTVIAPPVEKVVICPPYVCPETKCFPEVKYECEEKKYPWEGMHLGVDAWYGTFWYTDINMPRWPQF
ncbi:MAG TPA: hypothetical protein VLS45_07800 [Methylomicrobium sp.]|nr:hypothetical protein [Methylomicrobium sp.]